MSIKSKVFGFLNRVVKINTVVYSDEIIKYDSDNLFPQNIIKYISESGTATRCVDELERYATADGFVNEKVGAAKANDKQTFDNLLEELNQQSVYFEGNALHISRNTDGTIASVRVIPFENIRKTKNCLIYNPTLSESRYDKAKDKKHPYFMGAILTPEQLKEVAEFGEDAGEILYTYNRRPGAYVYPIPSFYAAI